MKNRELKKKLISKHGELTLLYGKIVRLQEKSLAIEQAKIKQLENLIYQLFEVEICFDFK